MCIRDRENAGGDESAAPPGQKGGTHHEIIVPGDYAARVRLLCRLLGIEFVEVDVYKRQQPAR